MDDGMGKDRMEPAGSPQRCQEVGGGEPAGGPLARRFSAKHNLTAVQRLQRGEPLELVARELNITAARLSHWRERAEGAAETALKKRERDRRDDEITRLEGGDPLARRKSRR